MEVERPAFGQRFPELHQGGLVPTALLGGTEEITHLPHRDEHARARHETEDHRLGHIARQIA